MAETLAREYINLTDLWENTDKNIVISNIERVFGEAKESQRRKDSTKLKALAKMADVGIHTAVAWTNHSRQEVKIPLLRLCMIADCLKIDVRKLLTDRGDWREDDSLSSRQVQMYEIIRKYKQYYSNEIGWDIKQFVTDMHSLERYGKFTEEQKIMQLTDDCITYFRDLVGIEDDSLMERIRNTVTEIFLS